MFSLLKFTFMFIVRWMGKMVHQVCGCQGAVPGVGCTRSEYFILVLCIALCTAFAFVARSAIMKTWIYWDSSVLNWPRFEILIKLYTRKIHVGPDTWYNWSNSLSMCFRVIYAFLRRVRVLFAYWRVCNATMWSLIRFRK